MGRRRGRLAPALICAQFVSRAGIVVTTLWAALGLLFVAGRVWITHGETPVRPLIGFMVLWLVGTGVLVGGMYISWRLWRFVRNHIGH